MAGEEIHSPSLATKSSKETLQAAFATQIKPVSLADVRLFCSVFVRSFKDDAQCYWMFRWSPLGSPERPAQDEWAINYRIPSMRRFYLNPQSHLFFSLDEATNEVSGLSGWISPSSSNAKHLRRTLTWKEWALSMCYKVYDSIIPFVVPQWLYDRLHPETREFYDRRRRWAAIINDAEHCVRKDHREQGYWMLAILGILSEYERRGIASKLIQWGLDKADEEDRAVYLSSSPPGVRLYQKHGFEVILKTPCFEGEPFGGFHQVVMCRPRKSDRK